MATVVDEARPSDCSAQFGVGGERRHRHGGRAARGAPADSRRAPCGACADRRSSGLSSAGRRNSSRSTSSSLSGSAQRSRNALQRADVELLRLMRDHARFAGLAHAKALLGLGEDHGRAAARRPRLLEGGVKLAEIVAAALQPVDLAIRHARHQRPHLRVFVEEMREIVGAVLGAERLILAVDGGGEAAQQRMGLVAREQRVPIGAPQHLDDMPAGGAEHALQLLDDLPVAAHGAVEPLQVAVDDEAEVVELFAPGEREAGERLRLVHLAVAEHAPDPPRARCRRGRDLRDSAGSAPGRSR